MNQEQAALLHRVLLDVGIEASQFRHEAVFGTAELPLDSVMFMRLLVELENAFQVEINLLELTRGEALTYGQLLDYLAERIPNDAY
ncbi:phosphopantetheine-binding protein [Paenibacillus sp. FSL H8-0537]|uniref:phosphopantetheine-binding protein n=1 Tax=Paenibacillus sp. FSL H8-0537 TaxID=2921399 RepID=UPI00310102B5